MFIPGGNTFIGLLSVCVAVGAASNYVHEKGAARPLLLGRNGWRPIKRENNHEHTLKLNEHEEDFTLAGWSEQSSASQLAGQSKPKRSAHRRRKHPHHAGHNDFSLNLAASKDNIQEDYDYNIEEEVQDIPTGDDRFDSFHSHDNDNVHGSSVPEGDAGHDVTEESDPKPSNGFRSDKAGSFGASLVPHRSGPNVIQPPIIYFEEPKPGPEQNAGTPLSQDTNGTLVPVDPTISLPTSPSDDIKPEGPKTATEENTFDLAAQSTVQTPVAASTNRPDIEQKTVTSQPSSSANGQFTVPYFNSQATLGHTDLVSSIPDKLTTPGGLTEPVPAFTSVSADDVVNITPATSYTTRGDTGTTFVQSESSTTARSTDEDLHQKTENPFYSSTARSFR
ncbi:uncharacterized protein [Bemisia tabaci]|uniref:uncharacterized protein n=1 Tax=Bemisia tabaci TaxID=7038 RepID=UPI003B283BA1